MVLYLSSCGEWRWLILLLIAQQRSNKSISLLEERLLVREGFFLFDEIMSIEGVFNDVLCEYFIENPLAFCEVVVCDSRLNCVDCPEALRLLDYCKFPRQREQCLPSLTEFIFGVLDDIHTISFCIADLCMDVSFVFIDGFLCWTADDSQLF